ncbi:RNA polymerase, sigma 54 subunit, RpoN/SigL [Psychroflexus salarius]|uniref:RNA polymerase, sigma 54 subunit, RpoN/SigL n=1 Tax=Psychroflexus salarius TaxID=1155689 RepID=A0A1M4UCH7_9FLAO|nr:RNA polymerase factor sigma-54 [Psychroflexus salarius]SHE54435.1 RNA polymerase, sigma 54 subunit, RpoN/SigL [Psychroflexus salarius]
MLKQQLNLKLSQKLSPQQIQLMKLIQLPTVAFEQRLRNELEENPALESGKDEYEDDEFKNEEYENDSEVIETEFDVDDYLSDDEVPSYKLKANNYSKDSEDNQIPYASGISFTQYLKNQLHTINLSDDDLLIAEFLIGSVDSSGYLRRKLIDIVDDLAFTQNIFTTEDHVLRILKIVQTLDPAGVCSRDLQECLSLQLERKKPSKEVNLAKQLINEAFNMFSKKHYQKLISKFSVSEEELKSAIEVIEHLNPKPGASYSSNTRIVEHVIPDFTIRIKNGELELTLNGRNSPEMHVSHEYANMLKAYKESKNKTKSQKEAVLFIKQKLDSAKWFIDAIKQRQHTLFSTMSAIMNYQRDYFLSGDETDIKPMILKDIAEKIDMDISTVSRVANSKYVDTPYGTFLIKEFFSESMKNDQGEDVSTREIKNILESVVNKENKKKPYTDAKLTELLKEKGYPIARRTVAKYREQLDIPVARLRKEI